MTVHVTRELLYGIIGLLAGGLLGTINGFCLFGAWINGWIFGVTVPEHLASNDLMSARGTARSKVENERAFAWSDRYHFIRDSIGNVTYSEKIPYAGDGEG